MWLLTVFLMFSLQNQKPTKSAPNEIYSEVEHSINKFKFSVTVLVVSGCWNLVTSIKIAFSTHTLYSRDSEPPAEAGHTG